jgi:hypothetical protein
VFAKLFSDVKVVIPAAGSPQVKRRFVMDSSSFLFGFIILVLVASVILMTLHARDKKVGGTVGFGCFAMVLLFLVIIGAAYEVGYGNVVPVPQDLTKLLKTGTAYQLISSVKDGDDYVLLLKKPGGGKKSYFYAIRVKEIPPEHFTLVNGKPVAIAPPAPPVGVK